jgi:acyl-CoA reductase-like NAD-dependent aldehyde dehydrogenase
MANAGTAETEKTAGKKPCPVITDDGFILSFNPRTGEELEKIATTPVEDVKKIVAEARQAQKQWAAKPFFERERALKKVSQYFLDNMDKIAEDLARENGKTNYEAILTEVLGVVDFIAFFASKAKKALADKRVPLHMVPMARSYLTYQPVGVVGVIAPWNYPLLTPISDIAPALAAGNAVVFKPSEFSAGSGKLIVAAFKAAGFPEGLLRAVYGGGDVGAALVSSGVDHIGFTGSTATGKKVMEAASKTLTPVTLELGGKDPAIVRQDADLDQAVQGILWGGFANMGQTCASVERVYVHEGIYDKFKDKLVAAAKKQLTLDPNDPHSQFGSMNNAPQAALVNRQIDDAVTKGANVLFKLETPETGFYAPPTIIDGVTKDMECFSEETFGPIIPLYKYTFDDEVVKMANDSPYGLTASIWTKNTDRGEMLARSLHAGVVTINDHMITPAFAEAPWGGVKDSGIGRVKSEEALRSFSEVKYIYHDRGLMPHKAWRYPYTKGKLQFLKDMAIANNDASLFNRAKAYMRILPQFVFGFKEDA